MKRKYSTPVASEEVFMANSYVAACRYNKNTRVGGSQMRCIVPGHSDYNQIFTYVWVEAISGCETWVTANSVRTEGYAFAPNSGAVVYKKGKDANSNFAFCNTEYRFNGRVYYLPSDISTEHYGSYQVDGSKTQEIINNISS